MRWIFCGIAAAMMCGAATAHADDAIKVTGCQTIDKPGSYALAKNVVADPKTLVMPSVTTPQRYACIFIDADYVTLDLAGFSVIGDTTPETFGILAADHKGIVVRNGAVTGFTLSGVSLTGSYHTIENMRAIGNGSHGLSLFGGRFTDRGSIVRGSVASDNGRSGISVATPGSTIVTGNVTLNNALYGIVVSCPSVVTQNMAFRNGVNQIWMTESTDPYTREPLPPCTASDNSPQ